MAVPQLLSPVLFKHLKLCVSLGVCATWRIYDRHTKYRGFMGWIVNISLGIVAPAPSWLYILIHLTLATFVASKWKLGCIRSICSCCLFFPLPLAWKMYPSGNQSCGFSGSLLFTSPNNPNPPSLGGGSEKWLVWQRRALDSFFSLHFFCFRVWASMNSSGDRRCRQPQVSPKLHLRLVFKKRNGFMRHYGIKTVVFRRDCFRGKKKKGG